MEVGGEAAIASGGSKDPGWGSWPDQEAPVFCMAVGEKSEGWVGRRQSLATLSYRYSLAQNHSLHWPAQKFLDGLCRLSASSISRMCQRGAAPRSCPPRRSRPSRLPEVTQRLGQSPMPRVPNPKPRIRKSRNTPCFLPRALWVWEVFRQLTGLSQKPAAGGGEEDSPMQ